MLSDDSEETFLCENLKFFEKKNELWLMPFEFSTATSHTEHVQQATVVRYVLMCVNSFGRTGSVTPS